MLRCFYLKHERLDSKQARGRNGTGGVDPFEISIPLFGKMQSIPFMDGLSIACNHAPCPSLSRPPPSADNLYFSTNFAYGDAKLREHSLHTQCDVVKVQLHSLTMKLICRCTPPDTPQRCSRSRTWQSFVGCLRRPFPFRLLLPSTPDTVPSPAGQRVKDDPFTGGGRGCTFI